MAADDFTNADDDEGIVDMKPRHSTELYALCTQVRNELLPEWNGSDEDNDDLIELTPDGEAVIDGAFRAIELFRIAEAIGEAMRRCAPATGLTAPLILDRETVPAPLDALHRLKFTLGIAPGSPGAPMVDQCERAFQYLAGKLFGEQQHGHEQLAKIRQLEGKLSSCVAVVEAQKRANAAGGDIVQSELVDNLLAALQA